MRGEPGFGFCFRDDGEDLDFFLGDVIEDSDVVYPKAILRLRKTSEAFDPALVAQCLRARISPFGNFMFSRSHWDTESISCGCR